MNGEQRQAADSSLEPSLSVKVLYEGIRL